MKRHPLLCECAVCTIVFGPLSTTSRAINVINQDYEGKQDQ